MVRIRNEENCEAEQVNNARFSGTLNFHSKWKFSKSFCDDTMELPIDLHDNKIHGCFLCLKIHTSSFLSEVLSQKYIRISSIFQVKRWTSQGKVAMVSDLHFHHLLVSLTVSCIFLPLSYFCDENIVHLIKTDVYRYLCLSLLSDATFQISSPWIFTNPEWPIPLIISGPKIVRTSPEMSERICTFFVR